MSINFSSISESAGVTFVRFVDLVTRMLQCREKFPSIHLTGSFVYNYIVLCEEYGLKWDQFSSIAFLAKKRYILAIGNINLMTSNEELIEVVNLMETIFGKEAFRESDEGYKFELLFNDPFSKYCHSINIYVTCNPSFEFDIANVKWNGETCSFISTRRFVKQQLEARLAEEYDLSDPCVRRYAFNQIVVQGIVNRTAIYYGYHLHYFDVIRSIYNLGIHKGYEVHFQKDSLEIVVVAYYPQQANVGECIICGDKLGCCKSNKFKERAFASLQCSKEGPKHNFHVECLAQWGSRKANCPICRTVMDDEFLEAYTLMATNRNQDVYDLDGNIDTFDDINTMDLESNESFPEW